MGGMEGLNPYSPWKEEFISVYLFLLRNMFSCKEFGTLLYIFI